MTEREQLEALYGPLYPHSDHKLGETIRFYDVVTRQEHTGTIEWVKGPGETTEGGHHFPVIYVMDSIDPSTGFPWEVFPSDVIA
jgi:hypothetical protein